MLVFMKHDTPEAAIRSLVIQLSREGIGVARAESAGRALLTLVGPTWTLDEQRLLALPYVDEMKRLTPVWRLADRRNHPENTVVTVGETRIGEGFCLMAGPCAIESAFQMQSVARSVKAAGASILRGGAYKPRTSPYTSQGMGERGLDLLKEASAELDMPVVTEVMDPRDVQVFLDKKIDVMQIGARNAQNFPLLKEVGKTQTPILLKRGMSGTVDELLMAAEYIMSEGNDNVILCERGIRTFETSMRNTLDLAGVVMLHKMTHLPVVVDPSHACGHAWMVPELAKAAVAAGADGLMIEVHNNPAKAKCDGAQSLTPDQFDELMQFIGKEVEFFGKKMN